MTSLISQPFASRTSSNTKSRLLITILTAFLFNFHIHAQGHSDSVIKGFRLLKVDKLVFSLDTSIQNIDDWITLLENSQSVGRYFCYNCSDSMFIRISKIEQIDSVLFKLSIRRRPLRLEVFIPPNRCSYYVRVGTNKITKRKEIVEVYSGGCEI